MKTGILCNSKLAIPVLHFFLQNQQAFEVGMPDADTEETDELKHFLGSASKGFSTFSQKELAAGLKRWIERNKLDTVLVVTFPWKIPVYTLSLPPLGFYNFHYALLPQYRGAAPVFWQIKNGERYGGLTIHKMDEGWDTGPIAQQMKVEMLPGETYGLHNARIGWQTLPSVREFMQKLMLLGKALPLIPQEASQAKYYSRPGLGDVIINWQQMAAVEIQRLVNACNPWNKGAVTYFNQSAFKIIQVSVKEQSIVNNQKLNPGTVINCSEKKTIDIITVDNRIISLEIVNTDWGFTDASVLTQNGLKEGAELSSL